MKSIMLAVSLLLVCWVVSAEEPQEVVGKWKNTRIECDGIATKSLSAAQQKTLEDINSKLANEPTSSMIYDLRADNTLTLFAQAQNSGKCIMSFEGEYEYKHGMFGMKLTSVGNTENCEEASVQNAEKMLNQPYVITADFDGSTFKIFRPPSKKEQDMCGGRQVVQVSYRLGLSAPN